MIPEELLRAGKLDPQYIRIADKDTFKAKIRERLLTRDARPRWFAKKWAMILIPIVCIPVAGWGYQSIFPISTTQMTVEEGLRQIDFQVKRPTKLPFPVILSWADVTSIPEHKNVEITIAWANNNNTLRSIEERVVPSQFADQFSILSLQHPQIVRLRNGLPAMYSCDLGGQLVWKEDGNTYELRDVEGRELDKPFLTMTQLIEIAGSFK